MRDYDLAPRRVDVRWFETSLTDWERVDLDRWLDAHPHDRIDHITIAAHAVSVHATRPRRTEGTVAIALRDDPDQLIDALDQALDRVRNSR
jgi:hypothetical protein